ncbi:hypothetical protein QP958_09120, partial [Corynebacterium marquesiae]|uniref:hypothetical protein n=1 Tax=Corynebacterium marquesiae TaxID=2913503 RepID=UPI0025516D49
RNRVLSHPAHQHRAVKEAELNPGRFNARAILAQRGDHPCARIVDFKKGKEMGNQRNRARIYLLFAAVCTLLFLMSVIIVGNVALNWIFGIAALSGYFMSVLQMMVEARSE